MPDASKQEIRDFLSLFVKAFGFAETERLKLNPDDRVLAVYRTLYPIKGWPPDCLELEVLAEAIETKHGVDLESVWSESLTLRGLFAFVRRASMPG